MLARTVMGGVFIAILFLGIVYAAVSPTLQPIALPRFNIPGFAGGFGGIFERYALVKGTNVSEDVKLVSLNATVRFGAIAVAFSNEPNLALRAVYEHGANASELEANLTTVSADVIQVSLYGDTGGLNLTLGSGCQYDGDLGMRFGVAIMELGQYANVSRLAVKIRYAGGVVLNVTSGASFEKLDLNVDLGGVQLNTNAEQLGRSGTINMNVNMGGFIMGVDVNTASVGVSLEADVDVGGLMIDHEGFTGNGTQTHYSGKTVGYGVAEAKMDVVVVVGAGGGILQHQSAQLKLPGFGTVPAYK